MDLIITLQFGGIQYWIQYYTAVHKNFIHEATTLMILHSWLYMYSMCLKYSQVEMNWMIAKFLPKACQQLFQVSEQLFSLF